jgi:hypothetical protein
MRISIERWLSVANGVANKCERALARTLRIDCYEMRDNVVTKHRGPFRAESIIIDDINRWWIVHEMTCDIVYIERYDGTVVRWLDSYNDLIEILERTLVARRVATPCM